MFMQNVSSALQDGGRFYGTFTSAQAIISLLNNKVIFILFMYVRFITDSLLSKVKTTTIRVRCNFIYLFF